MDIATKYEDFQIKGITSKYFYGNNFIIFGYLLSYGWN
jgi:hypothetical protein